VQQGFCSLRLNTARAAYVDKKRPRQTSSDASRLAVMTRAWLYGRRRFLDAKKAARGGL
jgi:hypothetical protein